MSESGVAEVSFDIRIRGRVSEANQTELYEQVSKLLQTIGGLSVSQEVLVKFQNLGELASAEVGERVQFKQKDLSVEELESTARNFGSVVKNRRKQLELTQMVLATNAGISQSYLSKIETGKATSPAIEAVVNLATALDLNSQFLLETAGYEPLVLNQNTASA